MPLLGLVTVAMASSYPYTAINTWRSQPIQQNYRYTFFMCAQYLGPDLEILMDFCSGTTQRNAVNLLLQSMVSLFISLKTRLPKAPTPLGDLYTQGDSVKKEERIQELLLLFLWSRGKLTLNWETVQPLGPLYYALFSRACNFIFEGLWVSTP